jgi:type II secretory pathway pseudopilin PulG
MSRNFTPTGATLLEVIVALAVLASATAAAAASAIQSQHALQRSMAAETELLTAHRLLDAVALWPRETLEQRFGARRQGPFLLSISGSATGVFEVAVLDSNGTRELLSTSIYRRGPGSNSGEDGQ